MFLGFNLAATILFVPDTFWDRNPVPSKRSLEETKLAQSVATYHPPSQRPNAFALQRPSQMNITDIQSLSSSIQDEPEDKRVGETPVGITEPTEPPEVSHTKNSYWLEIKLYRGRYTKDSWWMVALRPFILYSYPSILFGALIYSLAVVWLIVISETISEILDTHHMGMINRRLVSFISPLLLVVFWDLYRVV